MKVGVNFWGLKTKLHHDFEGTLQRVIAAGASSAEVCVLFTQGLAQTQDANEKGEMEQIESQDQMQEFFGGIWPEAMACEKIAQVRAAGLVVESCHVICPDNTPQKLEATMQRALQFAKIHGIRYMVISLMKNYEDMQAYIPLMDRISRCFATDGITLAYHNHDMEVIGESGSTALDALMMNCPELKLELDVGWVKFAGSDAIELMGRYKDRLLLLHLKDILADASSKNQGDCFTAIGEGSIPLAAIMHEAKMCPIDKNGYIVDQDNSFGDIIDDLAVGIQNMVKL